MNRIRVIPVLSVINGDLVKTKKFKNPKYIGDPINAVKIFNDKCVDELFFVDIRGSLKNTEPNFDLIEEIASECFMPVGYGGGIKNINQAKRIIQLGIEKLSFNSAFITNPKMCENVASNFGSQSVVAVIDVKKNIFGKEKVSFNSGKQNTKYSVLEMAKKVEDYGAGEIIVQSIDDDGMQDGYNLDLLEKVSQHVSIPVVPLGGAKNLAHLKEAIEIGASALAASSMFVFHGVNDAVLINYLNEQELNTLNEAFEKASK